MCNYPHLVCEVCCRLIFDAKRAHDWSSWFGGGIEPWSTKHSWRKMSVLKSLANIMN